MSTTYGLYNLSTKKWIDIGKPIYPEERFQANSYRIVEFLLDSISCDLIIVGDDKDTPNEKEEGWEEIGSLWN